MSWRYAGDLAMIELKRLTDNPAVPPLLLAVLVILGGILRFRFAGQDLFADELATYWIVSTHTLPGVLDVVSTTAEITPPLGFLLSWLTTRVDLAPEFVRLPALVAGIGTIPLVYLIGARTVGRSAGLLAAALTTFSPFMIFYSAEARGYGVLMAFVLLSTLMLLAAVDRDSDRYRFGWWLAYAVFACMAAYTHYTSIFVLGAQFLWVFWARPDSRRPLLVATAAAALLYVPWLPGLKADLDSPTMTILNALSPFTFEAVRLSLSHWAVGFPFAQFVSLREVPGIPALLLVGGSICVGATSLLLKPPAIGRWLAGRDWQVLLVFALALATPVGEALQSALGTNVFSTRSLAPSWPYLALAAAAVITAGRGRLRPVAAGLAVTGFAISALMMAKSDFERPDYSQVARLAGDGRGGVVVDSAALTPGPLANFDVEGSSPGLEVLRLNVPEERRSPFNAGDQLPEPSEVARRAVEAADGGPITVVSLVSPRLFAGRPTETALTAEFLSLLPPSYTIVERKLFPGLIDLQVLVLEQESRAGGG